jgi:hypothetical protein
MDSEGPSGTTGDPGAGFNPWTVGAVPIDARIQIAHSPDRTKMFYSWTMSDPTFAGNNWNIFPDIFARGFDVTINKVTPRLNVTLPLSSTPGSGTAFFNFMSNRTMVTNSTTATNEIPFTIAYNSTTDGNNPMQHYYIKGASFEQADFTLNPMSPTGINSQAVAAVDYNVANYPNPATDFTTIMVNLKDAKPFDITVYNTIGQLVQTIKVDGEKGNNEVTLDVSKLSKGMYVYNVNVNGSVVSNKLIVE